MPCCVLIFGPVMAGVRGTNVNESEQTTKWTLLAESHQILSPSLLGQLRALIRKWTYDLPVLLLYV